jgi:hypothetical protein
MAADEEGPIKKIQSEIELQGELNALYEQDLELRRRKENVELRIRQLSGEQIKQSELIQTQAEIRIQAAERMREYLSLSNVELDTQVGYLTRIKDTAAGLTGEQAQRLRLLREVKTAIESGQVPAMKKALDLETAGMAQLKKRTQLAGNLSGTMGGLLGVTDAWVNTTEGQILQLATMRGSMGSLTAAMREQFSVSNMGGGLITKVTEATVALLKEQDAAIASFKQATGAGGAYNDIIIDSHINLRTYGVSTAQAARATGDLFSNMAGFSEMNKSAQMNLVQTTALLDRFGVGSRQAAQALDFMTKGLKMSSSQAVSTTRNLVGLGQALKVPPEVIFTQFTQASSQLAAHGGNMINVFQGLAAAAKASGAEMAALLSYAGQFDVFATGATAVGKLNALLGGPYLNTVQMINAEEHERIGLTIAAIEASGRQFSTMGKFQQIAIANAAGIKDMAQANKLLGMSSSEYRVMQSRVESATMSEEKFKKVTQDAMSVVQKFSAIAKSFAMNMSFLLKPLGWLADQILSLQKTMGDWFGVFALGTGIIVFFTGKVLGLGAALSSVLSSSLAATGPAIQAVGVSAGTAGKAAQGGAVGLLAFGAAVLGVGAGIWLATTGIVNLVDALGRLSGPEMQAVVPLLMSMTLAFGVLTVGLVAVASVGWAAVPPLLAMGAAFLGIGAGVWMASEGMASLADSLGRNASGIEKVLASTTLLVPLVATLASVSAAAGHAMLSLGAGFAALAVGLLLLPLEKLEAMAEIAKMINEANAAGGPDASPAANAFGNTIHAVNNLDANNVNLAQSVAATAAAYNSEAATSTAGGSSVTNGLLRGILNKLGQTGHDTALAIATSIGEINLVQNGVVTARSAKRTSLDNRRASPGSAARIY